MKWALAAVPVLLYGSVAFAVVGGGDVTIENKGGTVIFSHEAHNVGAGLVCKDCHPKLYTNKRQHKPVSMEEKNKGKSCGACHNDRVATFSVTENCELCHQK